MREVPTVSDAVLFDVVCDQQHYTELYNLTGKQEYKDIADRLKQEVEYVKKQKTTLHTCTTLLQSD